MRMTPSRWIHTSPLEQYVHTNSLVVRTSTIFTLYLTDLVSNTVHLVRNHSHFVGTLSAFTVVCIKRA